VRIHFNHIIFLFYITQIAQAQEFGGHPFNQKWKQINTDTVRIIFQEGFEKQASRIARIEHYLASSPSLSLGNKFKKINIVLQNHTLQSNGYVGLAPFRSEFFTTGLQNPNLLGSLPFLDLLALHEYRHVQQEVNFKKGWNKVLFFLNGEIGWSIGSGLAIPNWFFEGDAVLNETRYSTQGRGRLPSFLDSYRGLLLSKTNYSYSKTRNGSFKDFVPNHYEFGYLMCLYGIEHFGTDIWRQTTQNTFNRIPIYPFSRALKKHTGLTTKNLYKNTIQEFNLKNQRGLDSIAPSVLPINNEQKKTFTSYQYPIQLEDGRIMALKKAYNKIPTIVIIDKDQNEMELVKQGFTNHEYISYRNNKIAWVESSLNPRWTWRDYSEIVLYDLTTKKKHRLTSKTKLFSPDISIDGKQIAAIEINEKQKYAIQIFDSNSGEKTNAIPNPENYFLAFPRWIDFDKQLLVSARNQQGECAILRVEIAKEKITEVIPFQNQAIGQFNISGSKIIYTTAYEGYDNIFSFDTLSKQFTQISKSIIGQYEPAFTLQNDSILFSSFTSNGRNIYKLSFENKNNKIVHPKPLDSIKIFKSNSLITNSLNLLSTIDTSELKPSNYSQLKHLTYLHSWALTASNPLYGLNLYSDNILNNTSLQLGAYYNSNENTFQQNILVGYSGFYPVLNAGMENIQRSISNIAFNEHRTFVGIYVPLNFTKGIYHRTLKPIGNYSFRSIYNQGVLPTEIQNTEAGIEFRNARRKAYQHIFSRFGQYINIKTLNAVNLKNTNQLGISSEFNFPGIGTNHVVSIQADYINDEDKSGYRFQDVFVYPRGYGIFARTEALKIGFNYHMPVIYPDLGFAGIVYFKRIRTNFFFDYCATSYTTKAKSIQSTQLNSTGVELLFDLHFFHLSPIYSVFIRYSNLFNENYQNKKSENGVWEIGFPLVRIE
jgi:hypothetical protein